LTQIERGKTISFFNELDIETRTMLVTSVSFFNEVATEMQKLSSKWFHFLTSLKLENYAQRPLKTILESVSFFNELERRKKLCSKTSVSFFNEVASEMQKNYPQNLVSFFNELEIRKSAQRPLFHFLTRLPQRRKNYPRSLS
jgi:hypothetical protein